MKRGTGIAIVAGFLLVFIWLAFLTARGSVGNNMQVMPTTVPTPSVEPTTTSVPTITSILSPTPTLRPTRTVTPIISPTAPVQ